MSKLNYFLAGVATALLLVLSVKLAKAEEVSRPEIWGVATVRSYHWDRSRTHVEDNYGFGVEYYFNKDFGLSIGRYKNSFGEPSNYAMAIYRPFHVGKWHAGVGIGPVSGYEPHTKILPMPVVSYEERQWGINVGVSPVVMGLQLKVKFEKEKTSE